MTAASMIAVVGPTATGKSDLAVRLAEELGGEVVNADALQLYRGMDIGTAKIPPAQRRGIGHHLLDVLEVNEEASVSGYQRAARQAVADIRARGRVPIAVGGSGLYLRALLDQIEFPPTDSAVRAAWERRAQEIGTPALHAELAARDLEAAAEIGTHDTRRVVRALEVGQLTGRSFRAFLPRPRYADPPTIQVGLSRDRAALHRRIEQRVHRMVEDGLLDEARRLRRQGLERSLTARRALGYEQALAVLDGTMDCAEAIAATIAGTRRLVRKQDTWFRRDRRVAWIDADDQLETAVARALEIIRTNPSATDGAKVEP